MLKKVNVLKSEQKDLKKKIRRGDFITVGKMLDIDAYAARMRFNRGGVQVSKALVSLFEARDKLIKEHQFRVKLIKK